MPNVDGYYQTLLVVAKRCFNEKQQEKGEDLSFLETYLRQVNHPVQVAPAARLVRFAGTTPDRLDRLLNALLNALDNVQHDDRAFSSGGSLASVIELQSLGVFCAQNSERAPEVFERLRHYAVEHLSGMRCADNALTADGKSSTLPAAIRQFNQSVSFEGYKVEAITEDEIKPRSLSGKAEPKHYWQTPKAAQLKKRYAELPFRQLLLPPKVASSNIPGAIEPPADDALHQLQAFQEFFEELAKWQPEENVTPDDFYHQKLLLYGDVLYWVSLSPLRDRVMQDYLNLLTASRTQFSNFPEWYAHFKTIFSSVVRVNGQSSADEVKAFIEASDDSFAQLYVRLIKLPAGK